MWQTLLAWFRANEFIAIWLEGIALVLIFGLDWRERIDQRKERREQHEETSAQLAASQSQLAAMTRSADAATEAALAAKKSADIAGALYGRHLLISSVSQSSICGITTGQYSTAQCSPRPSSHRSPSFVAW